MTPPDDAERAPGSTRADPAASWQQFWERVPPLPSHDREAAEYLRRLGSVATLDASSRVLDFGSGFGFVAVRLAPLVGVLRLWDQSASMRRHARAALAGVEGVEFVDLSDATRLPDLEFDLILVNSVIQYMSDPDLRVALRIWRRLLAPGGRVVVSDVLPPDSGLLADLWALLRFDPLTCLERIGSGLRGHWRTQRQTPMLRLSRDALRERAETAGFAAELLPDNLTHFTARFAAILSVPTP